MSDQKINEENKLKIWMLNHAQKNRLIDKLISEIDILENQLANIVSKIEKYADERKDSAMYK